MSVIKMSRDTSKISPPPLKRRRLATSPAIAMGDEPTTPNNISPPRKAIRVFSWNINAIDPFLPAKVSKITPSFKSSNPDKKTTSTAAPQAAAGPSLRTFLSRHNWPEILFLQEIKIRHGDSGTLSSVLSSLNTPLDGPDGLDLGPLDGARTYTFHTSLPRDKFNAKGFGGKLYGVATIIRKDFADRCVERVREPDWDLEGRVSIVETKLPPQDPPPLPSTPSGTPSLSTPSKPLALLNIYAVNGTSSPYRSPKTGLVTGTSHDHKTAFHSRLRDECLDLESTGFHVIVAGDLNVARGLWDGYPNLRTFPWQHCGNRADFNAKFFGAEDNERANAYAPTRSGGTKVEEGEAAAGKNGKCLDGVDVFRAVHGAKRKYTYYSSTKGWGSSCDRIDLIFVSRGLWESGRVLATDILDTPQERGPSDHVPLWVEIAMD